jgi:hypothetical protein
VIAALGFALFFFSDMVAAPFYMPEIQKALDEQCGEGVIQAQPTGFTRDPVMYWQDPDTTTECRFQNEQNAWVCTCGR